MTIGQVGVPRGLNAVIFSLCTETGKQDLYRVETQLPKPVYSTEMLSVQYQQFLAGTQLTTVTRLHRVETQLPKPMYSTGVLVVQYRQFLSGTQPTTVFGNSDPFK